MQKSSDIYNKNKLKKINIRLEENNLELLKEIAKQERRSLSAITREAIQIYLSNSITDKDLIYAALNDSKRKIEFMDKKLEIYFSFWHYALASIFAGLPDLSNYSEQERKAITKKARKRVNNLTTAFEQSIQEQPSLFQTLLADFIEQGNEAKGSN